MHSSRFEVRALLHLALPQLVDTVRNVNYMAQFIRIYLLRVLVHKNMKFSNVPKDLGIFYYSAYDASTVSNIVLLYFC